MPTPLAPSRSEHVAWSDVVAAAPELAERVRSRFAANLHHVLGTLRADGAPRLSGTEVRIDATCVTLGMMPASRKLADVTYDPRVEIHSAPLEEDLREGDAKLAGYLVAREAPDGVPAQAGFFELAIDLVSLVHVAEDRLVLTTWRPGRGVRETRRT